MIVIASLSVVATPTPAAELAGYLSLTTDDVYRGVTQSDGHGAAQIGADISFETGFYFGVWGSTVDIGNGITAGRDTRINYYAGYSHQLAQKWTIGGSVVAYRFPAAFGPLDYDHNEFSMSLNYEDRLWFEYSHIPDYYNSGVRGHNYEMFAEWPFGSQASLSAGIGYFDISAFTGTAYTHWQLGLSRPLGKVGLDLRYHDTDRWVPIVSSADRAGARLVLTARLQF